MQNQLEERVIFLSVKYVSITVPPNTIVRETAKPHIGRYQQLFGIR